MQRQVYRAQSVFGREEALLSLLKGREDFLRCYLQRDELLTLSVFRWERGVFAYYENVGRELAPEELFGDLSGFLEKWPGQDGLRFWVPMSDIYHGCEPVSAEYWRRKQPVKRAYATLGRLKPDGPETPPYRGKLDTHNTPGKWHELMNRHFVPWGNDAGMLGLWREIENVLYL